MSLKNLSNRLSDSGDRAGALRAIQEAVEIRRRLAAAQPAAFEPDLAVSSRRPRGKPLVGRSADAAARDGQMPRRPLENVPPVATSNCTSPG
jgi:hypothetical protein